MDFPRLTRLFPHAFDVGGDVKPARLAQDG